MTRPKDIEIDPIYLKEAFLLNEHTGELSWNPLRPLSHFKSVRAFKLYMTRDAGRPILGLQNSRGKLYRLVVLSGQRILVHRVVYAMTSNEWPSGIIDHINGDTLDNRPSNLRNVDVATNQRNTKRQCNNTSGVNGVSWHKKTGKWVVQVSAGNTRKHLGLFDDLEAAKTARQKWERENGYTDRHGRF